MPTPCTTEPMELDWAHFRALPVDSEAGKCASTVRTLRASSVHPSVPLWPLSSERKNRTTEPESAIDDSAVGRKMQLWLEGSREGTTPRGTQRVPAKQAQRAPPGYPGLPLPRPSTPNTFPCQPGACMRGYASKD
jgi:hypothetical protein